LIRDGKIAEIFEGDAPDPKKLNAEPIEGSGKTLLPGLIDTNVQLSAPGGVAGTPSAKEIDWRHVAYLFSGVTAIRSVGDEVAPVLHLRDMVARGERLASEVFFTGPLIQTDSPEQGAAIAMGLQRQGASGLFVDTARVPMAELKAAGLPILSRSEKGADTLIGGVVPPAAGYWIPALTAVEARTEPKPELLERSLVQQVAIKGLLERTRPLLAKTPSGPGARVTISAADRVVAGSGSGQMFVIHGPGIHRELALLVQAGLSPTEALRAATGRAAEALGVAGRIGMLKPGMEADLLLLDGNPLRDITVTERISAVIFRGERVARSELFEQEE
jgi:imidazolonepropionase-like amidohydrolase